MPQMRGGQGAGVFAYSQPLPTKQMRHNSLTQRAVYSGEIVCHLMGVVCEITSLYKIEYYIIPSRIQEITLPSYPVTV